jgi:hypothetical protein
MTCPVCRKKGCPFDPDKKEEIGVWIGNPYIEETTQHYRKRQMYYMMTKEQKAVFKKFKHYTPININDEPMYEP